MHGLAMHGAPPSPFPFCFHVYSPHTNPLLPTCPQAERHMRGIADTGYALREVANGTMPLNWRTALLVAGCCEAHLVSTISLIR